MFNLTKPLCDPSHIFLPTPAQVRTSRAIAFLLKCNDDALLAYATNSNYPSRQDPS